MWMRNEGAGVGVPFGPLKPGDLGASDPVIHDMRKWWGKWLDRPRKVYYCNPGN